MRVFFEEVVFDFPGVVNAQAIRQLHLLQRFLKQLLLGAIRPRAWQLMLIENAELHAMSFHRAHGLSLPMRGVLCPCWKSKSILAHIPALTICLPQATIPPRRCGRQGYPDILPRPGLVR